MDLNEKLKLRDAKIAREERFVNISVLVLCWCIVVPLLFALLTTVQEIQALDVDHRGRMIAYYTELWWILIPLVAAYYRIKNCHRALNL